MTADHRYDIPKLQLRRRSDEHPMAMFGAIVSAAFVAMFMLPGQDAAQAAVDPIAIEQTGEPVTTEKSARLHPADAEASEKDRACEGQAWGAESMDCLLMIAKENGEVRKVRMVFADQINSSAPNVF